MSEKDMQDLLDLVERQLGKSWLDLVEWLRDQNALEDVDARLAAGDHAGAIQAVEDAAKRYAADIHAGYVTAGQTAAEWLDSKVTSPVRFDVANHRAIAWARQNAADLVQGLTDEAKQSARAIIADGVEAGENPRTIAIDLRSSIGLTADQARAVASYRRALESGDFSDALGRRLSDGRSDKTIASARDRGAELTQAQIDLAVDRYRSNSVSYRAEVIARTEALRAAHAGTDELYRQAIDNGDVDADALTGQWNPGPATKDARENHRTAALLAQRPKIGEPFVLEDGTEMMHPGDPAGGAENNASCRCCRSVRMTL